MSVSVTLVKDNNNEDLITIYRGEDGSVDCVDIHLDTSIDLGYIFHNRSKSKKRVLFSESYSYKKIEPIRKHRKIMCIHSMSPPSMCFICG
jgi:hypothetical protein